MKNIIIPHLPNNTSLELFRLALQLYTEPMTVNFLEICELPDNYNDIITLKRDRQQNFYDAGFVKQVQQLRSRHAAQVQEVHFDYIYSNSPAVFRNYAHSKDATLVIYYDDASNSETTKMLLRSKLPLLYINKLPVSIESIQPIPAGKKNVQEPVLAEPAYEWQTAEAVYVQQGNGNMPRSQHVPASIIQQYNLLEHTLTNVSHQLKDSLYSTRKMNHLQRYFLNSQKLSGLLQQDKRQMLLLV